METTFGLPRYRFPPTEGVIEQVVTFCREAIDDGHVPCAAGLLTRQGPGNIVLTQSSRRCYTAPFIG